MGGGGGGRTRDNSIFLRAVLSGRQVDCTRKNRQLRDLTLLMKFMVSPSTLKSQADYHARVPNISLTHPKY